MDPLIKDLLTPLRQLNEKCGYESCPAVREGWINVHISPHSHAELGYMNTFDGHYTGTDDFFAPSRVNMRRILDATISELWVDKERKFTLSDSEMPYFFYWWSRRHDTVRRMVYELIRQGRLMIVGGGWGMADEASTYYQSVIDSYTYSLRKINATFLSCGRPLVAWQADTFGHSREYASLMAQMGYDGLFINPISFDDEIIRMDRKGLDFLWRGSDDLGPKTDIYTHKLFDGYWSPPGFCFDSMCSDPLLITSDSFFNNIDERVELFVRSIRDRQAPSYSTKQVLVMMGKRLGYFNAKIWFENIDKLINNVNTKTYKDGDQIHVMYSTPACYLKSVYEENPVLETKQDDFFPYAYDKNSYLSGMYTSRPTFKYLVREANIFLQISKQLQVLGNLGNNDALFEEFQWIMGVSQDHNVISGAMRPHVQSYYTKKLYLAVQRSTLLIEEAFNKIRGSPKTMEYRLCFFNHSACPNTEKTTFHIIVYNPLAWSVTMPIRLPILNKMYDVFDPKGDKVKAVAMIIPEQAKKIPNRRSNAVTELVFIAKLPALGFKSFYVDESESQRRKKSIIKKINKNIPKKYFIRQTSVDNATYFNDEENNYYKEIKSNRNDYGNTSNISLDKDVMIPKRIETVDFNNDTTTHRNSFDNKDDLYPSYEAKDRYLYGESTERFISNKYIQINLNEYRKVSSLNLSNGINIDLDIQFYFYASDDPVQLNSTKRNPGAYIFRPMDNQPEPIIDNFETKVYKSHILQEIHSKYSDYASFVLRLYSDSPVLEVDWIIGPVPISDNLGKDVFIRYMTNLENNGVFYTDANGRQTIKRIRNKRALYEPYNLDQVAGNYYPVTSRIYMEDLKKNLRFSIFNDRSQGGASLQDGSIDLMIHRRILTDDSGVQTYLNETDNDDGIIVRGTHYLYLTKSDFKRNRLFEKKFIKESELRPQIIVSRISQMTDKKKWLGYKNQFSGLKTKLPFGVHILTLQKWDDHKLLLRLENYLENIDVVYNRIKKVFLRDLFVDIKLNKVLETNLSANMELGDWVRLLWRTNGSFVKNFNEFYGSDKIEFRNDVPGSIDDVDLNKEVTLIPQQIRTFLIDFVYLT
ncbi:lysosomal alpha-mannosidase-like [Vanessa cardui]|uniref:lysosomal alpha-mannosidase-like n=1 Tax=Vanessa cardui TaxID=171605 RepID=UPI001F13AEF2|nr:lysosomal alpha-mannosidase-like [Vanessa cardui]